MAIKCPLPTGKSSDRGKTHSYSLISMRFCSEGRTMSHVQSYAAFTLRSWVQASQHATRWVLPPLSIPCCSFIFCFLVSTHTAHPTDALPHKWKSILGLLNIHRSVVCRFLCLWLLGTGKFESGTHSVHSREVFKPLSLTCIPAVAVLLCRVCVPPFRLLARCLTELRAC